MSDERERESFLIITDILQIINSHLLHQKIFERLKEMLKIDNSFESDKLEDVFKEVKQIIKENIVSKDSVDTLNMIKIFIFSKIPKTPKNEDSRESSTPIIDEDESEEKEEISKRSKTKKKNSRAKKICPSQVKSSKMKKVCTILNSHRSGVFKINNLQKHLHVKKKIMSDEVCKEILKDIRNMVRENNEPEDMVLQRIKGMI